MQRQGPPYPGPYPYDPSGMFRNPAGTQPFPTPDLIPSPVWVGGKVKMAWTGTAGGQTPYEPHSNDGCRITQWVSPLFDLYPWLRGGAGVEGPPNVGQEPIWRLGAPVALHVMVTMLPRTAPVGLVTTFQDLNVVSVEEAHPWDPANVLPITSEQDITATLAQGNPPIGLTTVNVGTNGLVVFTPPGGGTPVRYWRLRMIFRMFDEHADPTIIVAAALY